MTRSYSLSDVCRATGTRPRTVQFWTSSGVIKADPDTLHGGPGVPRKYSLYEAQVAAVLSEVNKFHLQVGMLRYLAEYLRRIFTTELDYNFNNAAQALQYAKEAHRKRAHGKRAGNTPSTAVDEITRINCWATFQEAKEFRTNAYLIIQIRDDGTCHTDIASDVARQNRVPGTGETHVDSQVTASDLLGDSASSLVIAVETILFDLDTTLTG